MVTIILFALLVVFLLVILPKIFMGVLFILDTTFGIGLKLLASIGIAVNILIAVIFTVTGVKFLFKKVTGK